MSAASLMVLACLLFATMGVCVKLASGHYATGEIVFYRGLIGALAIGLMSRWQGSSLRTAVPAAHFWRSLTGVTALGLWFYAIAHLPLATAMTLNYSSSVWMAALLIGGALLFGTQPVDSRVAAATTPAGCMKRPSASRPIMPAPPMIAELRVSGSCADWRVCR